MKDLAQLIGIVNSPAQDRLSIRWLNGHHPQRPSNPTVNGFLENGGIEGRAAGWCKLCYNNNPTFEFWPAEHLNLSIEFTIDATEIKISVSKKGP